jgi:hypothetical protein
VSRLEPIVKEIEAVYNKGVDQEYIMNNVLESLKNALKKEIIEIINEKKNEWDVIQDKSSAEANELKALFHEAKKNLKKDLDLEKIKANALDLYEKLLNMVQGLTDQIKNDFNINTFKERIIKSIVSRLKEDFKKQLATKFKELKASELNQASNVDEIKKEIKNLETSINVGINFESIQKDIVSRMKNLQDLINALEKNFKNGIDPEQLKEFILKASDKIGFQC